MPTRPRICTHVFTNGSCCGTVALRDSEFCYWHHSARQRQRNRDRAQATIKRRRQRDTGICLPVLEDANSLQVAVQEVIHAILDQRLDTQRGKLALYGLQIAAYNQPNMVPDPQADDHPRYMNTIPAPERTMLQLPAAEASPELEE